MAVRVRVEMEALPSMSSHALHASITSRMRSLIADEDPLKDRQERFLDALDGMLGELDVDTNRFAIVNSDDEIWCYFICESDVQLQQMHGFYMDGVMTDVLHRIFLALADADDAISIRRVQWDLDEYKGGQLRLKELVALGQCHGR